MDGHSAVPYCADSVGNYMGIVTIQPFYVNTYGRRAFSVVGPMSWNSLPDFIRDPASSTDCFRRLLKTYLFARY